MLTRPVADGEMVERTVTVDRPEWTATYQFSYTRNKLATYNLSDVKVKGEV